MQHIPVANNTYCIHSMFRFNNVSQKILNLPMLSISATDVMHKSAIIPRAVDKKLCFFSGKRWVRRRKRQLELINDFLVRFEGKGEHGGDNVRRGKTRRAEIKRGRIIFVSFYLRRQHFIKSPLLQLLMPFSNLVLQSALASRIYLSFFALRRVPRYNKEARI